MRNFLIILFLMMLLLLVILVNPDKAKDFSWFIIIFNWLKQLFENFAVVLVGIGFIFFFLASQLISYVKPWKG